MLFMQCRAGTLSGKGFFSPEKVPVRSPTGLARGETVVTLMKTVVLSSSWA